jgi:hypothetical protein
MHTPTINLPESGLTRVKTDSHLIVGPPTRSGYRVATCCKTCRTYLIYTPTQRHQERGGHLAGFWYSCYYDELGSVPRSIAYETWQDAYRAIERIPTD